LWLIVSKLSQVGQTAPYIDYRLICCFAT